MLPATRFSRVLMVCFRHLNNCALTIQKAWRGYLGRKYCRIRVRNLLMIMHLNFYNRMAVVIQSQWRGYYVRLHVHNFYGRKNYFKALEAKNELVRRGLAEFQKQLMLEAKFREREAGERLLNENARDKHHLVSTLKMRGIYNSPFKKCPDEMELRLKALFHLDYLDKKHRKPRRKVTLRKESKPYSPETSQKGVRYTQGPFKPPHVVRRLRNKTFKPYFRLHDCDDLRVAREQWEIDENARIIHDVPFRSFYKYQPKYVGLLHTLSAYDVSNKLFLREEDPSKNISKKPMRTVISPIAFFDSLYND